MDVERTEAETVEIITPEVEGSLGSGNRLMLWLGVFFIVLAVVLLGNRNQQMNSVAQSEIAGETAVDLNPPPVSGDDLISEETVISITLPDSYDLNFNFNDLGPQLLAAGAIDYNRFVALYEQTGRPLTAHQKDILQTGGDVPVVIDFVNAHFLLNFFWALGLSNENLILTEGPMVQYSEGEIGRFASTGGWTLGQYPATQLYAATPIVPLTAEQQVRLETVTQQVYRPCCNNHTAFADCNHGMAMLGLLTVLAAQDASEAEMFATAKAVNGFWFPQQTLEAAGFFQAYMGLDYADVDPQLAVGRDLFSSSGFQQVHQWLADNNLLDQAPANGGSCGVS